MRLRNLRFVLAGCIFLAFVLCAQTVRATITVKSKDANKQAEHRKKIAKWLTMSLGTKVTIDDNGKINVADGGNKAAKRLRDMVNDASTSITIEVVENDANVANGRWNRDSSKSGNKTTGTQTIDIADIEAFNNVRNSYGLTPDSILMHEITEVYEGLKNNYDYGDAHTEGLKAEKEVMGEHSTTIVKEKGRWPGGYYIKIKRPDGTYVVVKIDGSGSTFEVTWYKEKNACQFVIADLIEIADPDPFVWAYNRTMDGEYYLYAERDVLESSPTGVAHDALGNVYICEDFSLQGMTRPGEIRIFDQNGNPLYAIIGPELQGLSGIDVDQQTGDIFIAASNVVIRYSSDGEPRGTYSPADFGGFSPSDVAIWRDNPVPGLPGTGMLYHIYVTDRESSQVFIFDVEEDMMSGTYQAAFGSEYLSQPEGLTVGPLNDIWVANTGNNQVQRFVSGGDYSPFKGLGPFLEDPSKRIYDVEVVIGHGVYVVDETKGSGGIYLYDFNGMQVTSIGVGQVQCPQSISAFAALDMDNLVEIYPPTPDMGLPIADAGPDSLTAIAGEPVTFDGSYSLNAVAYEWDFGDGFSGSGPTLTHIYANDGDFTVTLTAYDEVGLMSTDICMVLVYPGPACEGDFDNDLDVNGSDLAVFAADFGRTDCHSGSPCEGDFDGDGDVDGSDLALFAADFGRTDCPLPTYQTYIIELEKGYSTFTLPIEPLSSYTADSLLTDINTQYGKLIVTSISRWSNNDNDFEEHILGQGDGFDIEVGQGYFIYCLEPSSFKINGQPVEEITYYLNSGFNLIGLPANFGPHTAESFMMKVNNQGGSAEWMDYLYEDRWYRHNLGDGTGFPINRDEGYWIWCDNDSGEIIFEKDDFPDILPPIITDGDNLMDCRNKEGKGIVITKLHKDGSIVAYYFAGSVDPYPRGSAVPLQGTPVHCQEDELEEPDGTKIKRFVIITQIVKEDKTYTIITVLKLKGDGLFDGLMEISSHSKEGRFQKTKLNKTTGIKTIFTLKDGKLHWINIDLRTGQVTGDSVSGLPPDSKISDIEVVGGFIVIIEEWNNETEIRFRIIGPTGQIIAIFVMPGNFVTANKGQDVKAVVTTLNGVVFQDLIQVSTGVLLTQQPGNGMNGVHAHLQHDVINGQERFTEIVYHQPTNITEVRIINAAGKHLSTLSLNGRFKRAIRVDKTIIDKHGNPIEFKLKVVATQLPTEVEVVSIDLATGQRGSLTVAPGNFDQLIRSQDEKAILSTDQGDTVVALP